MQVIVDPADLRRFASVLEQEMHALCDRLKVVEAARRELSQAWRDTRYQSFENTYSSTLQILERFQKASERYAAHLRVKADRADKYLGRR